MMLQPIITVAPDGRTATGRWQGMVQLAELGANGVWGVGQYENAYVKERGLSPESLEAFGVGYAPGYPDFLLRRLAQDLGPGGTRVNGISAGPIKTLAAAGISGFGKILKSVEDNAPLRRNVTIDEVGNVAAFLMSDLASGVTGEITYVDAGFNTVVSGTS